MPSSHKLVLRALEPEDLDLLYQLENDTRFWANANTTVPYSRYALKQYLTTVVNDIYKDGQVRLVAELSGTAIGLVDLFHFDPMHQRAEVGILLLPEHQGKGLAAQALTALYQYARTLLLHQIYAIVSNENQPAAHAFEHAGFTPTIPLRQWLNNGETFVDATLWQFFL